MNKQIDLLERGEYVSRLKDIFCVANENNKSITLALNGKWGSGKTFLINMLEEAVRNDFVVVNYNAWEKDFYDEPLIGMLQSLIEELNSLMSSKNLFKGLSKEIIRGFISLLEDAISSLSKAFLKVDVVKITKRNINFFRKIKSNEEIKTDFNDNSKIDKAIVKVNEALCEISKKAPILFIVDEIDRCAPAYTLKILNRIHHFLSSNAKIQVLCSIDKEQLNHQVKTIMGYDVDLENYYKKFFDYTLLLNEGNRNNNFDLRFNEYDSCFSNKCMFSGENIADFKKELFSFCNIRTQNKIVEKAYFIHKLISKEEKYDRIYQCAELLFAYISECSTNGENKFVKYFGSLACPQCGYDNPSKLNDFSYVVNSISDEKSTVSYYADFPPTFCIVVKSFWSCLWSLITKVADIHNEKLNVSYNVPRNFDEYKKLSSFIQNFYSNAKIL